MITFIVQVKTNEVKIPWDPKEDEQKVDPKNARDGIDQLQRDCLRFLEMVPDIKMGGAVTINLRLAFPLALNTQYDDVLIKGDFKEENRDKLPDRLGICTLSEEGNITSIASLEIYKKIVCRYFGPHSHVQSKTSFSKSVNALNFAIQEMDTGIRAEVQEVKTVDPPIINSVMKAISCDILMRRIKSAKENKTFGEKFLKDNPKIPLQFLKVDSKTKLITNSQEKNFPIFGRPLVDRILTLVDDQVSHQGSEKILSRLQKDKYVFYNENGDPVNLALVVSRHVRQCCHCQEVKEIHALCPDTKGPLLIIPPEHISKVLQYSDRQHQGYRECYRRIVNWCDFGDDLEHFKTLVICLILVYLHY